MASPLPESGRNDVNGTCDEKARRVKKALPELF